MAGYLFVITVASLICLSEAASITRDDPTPSYMTNLKMLWDNPCGNPQRTTRSTPQIKELQFLLNILTKDASRKLRKMYDKRLEIGTVGNCPKMNSLWKPLRAAWKNGTDPAKVVNEFHGSLLELAVYLEHLAHMQLKTDSAQNAEIQLKRIRIYNQTRQHLQLAICEFSSGHVPIRHELSEHRQHKLRFNVDSVEKIKVTCVPEMADLTVAGQLDIQFFKTMRKFLKRGLKLMKRLGWKNGQQRGRKKGKQQGKRKSGHKKTRTTQ